MADSLQQFGAGVSGPGRRHHRKVAVIGAGSVGATVAYACLIRGVADEIAIYDIDAGKARAQALDLQHGLQFCPPAAVEGGGDLEICRWSDIICVTAGAKQKPGQNRLELAEANVDICRQVIPKLMRMCPNATILMVTNPVDVLTYAAVKLSGLPAERVVGSGTVLDSSRFRQLLARRLNVNVRNVHAYIAGEHGESEVPLWSSATIGTTPLLKWDVADHGGPMDEAERDEIFHHVRTAAATIIEGKGATNYAIGLSAAEIIDALFDDVPRVMPVSQLLTGFAGLEDVCLSVPAMVGDLRVEPPLPTPMDESELAGMRKSADIVHKAIRQIGY